MSFHVDIKWEKFINDVYCFFITINLHLHLFKNMNWFPFRFVWVLKNIFHFSFYSMQKYISLFTFANSFLGSILSFQIEAERINLFLKKIRSYFIAAFSNSYLLLWGRLLEWFRTKTPELIYGNKSDIATRFQSRIICPFGRYIRNGM